MNTMLKTAILSLTLKQLLSAVALVLLTTSCNPAEERVSVYASISFPECTIVARQDGSDILVRITVANHSQSPYRLLEWNLPKNGAMTSALFQVTHDGSVVEYRGRTVKRAVTRDRYIQLAPGRSLSAEIGLSQAYDVQSPGNYAITYKAFNQRDDGTGLDTLTSNTVTIVKR
jgi:hypothetical protein